ncbi:hypothetical protein CYL16_12160 [Mycobacterium sp. EPG1]|nr:hypothetical protein CYL16_12160 [Mycobacterium sp. EPG1]
MVLLAALLLPWNIHFGVGVPDSAPWLYAVTVASTLLACSAALGPSDRFRTMLTAPYLLVIAGFVVFALVDAVRVGGSGEVAAGIGPGAILGLGGALLLAKPSTRLVKALGIAAMAVAILAVVSNMYWRTRYVLPTIGDPAFGTGNATVVATVMVYGIVALIAVLAGLRWLLDARPAAQLANVALGVSTALGVAFVWCLPIGRDIDAFHGIAQTTSTAAVGFEGYLVWVAAAAIFAPLALQQARTLDKSVWRDAVRKGLALIAIWFVGCAALRTFDLITTASLDLPLSPYDSIGLLAFDVVAAAVAVWVRFNMTNEALHPVVVSALCGVLFVLAVCRVAVGVGLAPRILYMGTEDLETAVYGNSLAQQITSTFDVVMCWLALAVALVALLVLQRERRSTVTPPGNAAQVTSAPTQQLSELSAPPTQQLWGRPTAPTQRIPSAAPRIARTADGTQPSGQPKIARVLEESTQRFAAGTTYTGRGRPQD